MDLDRDPVHIDDARLLVEQLKEALFYAQKESHSLVQQNKSVSAEASQRDDAHAAEEKAANDEIAHSVANLQQQVDTMKAHIKDLERQWQELEVQKQGFAETERDMRANIVGLSEFARGQKRKMTDVRARWVALVANRVAHEYEQKRLAMHVAKVATPEYDMLVKVGRWLHDRSKDRSRLREVKAKAEATCTTIHQMEELAKLRIVEACEYRLGTMKLVEDLRAEYRNIDRAVDENLRGVVDFAIPEKKMLEQELEVMEKMYADLKRQAGFATWS